MSSIEHVESSLEDLSNHEVPATVVCSRCGRPDCPGCDPGEDDTAPSRILVPVPWEDRDLGVVLRGWRTVRAACGEPAKFFGGLPSGALGPSLTFAILVELASVGSWIAAFAGLMRLMFASFVRGLCQNPATCRSIMLSALTAWVGFSGLLVGMRVLYAWMLDKGARRFSTRGHRLVAFRLGLYSTGWDLLSSPLGWLMGVITAGPVGMIGLLKGALKAPSVATASLLQLVYHARPREAEDLRRYATMRAIAASIALSIIVLGAAVFVGLQ